jgi:hypothetical protein
MLDVYKRNTQISNVYRLRSLKLVKTQKLKKLFKVETKKGYTELLVPNTDLVVSLEYK